jgi:hypothetical protein
MKFSAFVVDVDVIAFTAFAIDFAFLADKVGPAVIELNLSVA